MSISPVTVSQILASVGTVFFREVFKEMKNSLAVSEDSDLRRESVARWI